METVQSILNSDVNPTNVREVIAKWTTAVVYVETKLSEMDKDSPQYKALRLECDEIRRELEQLKERV